MTAPSPGASPTTLLCPVCQQPLTYPHGFPDARRKYHPDCAVQHRRHNDRVRLRLRYRRLFAKLRHLLP